MPSPVSRGSCISSFVESSSIFNFRNIASINHWYWHFCLLLIFTSILVIILGPFSIISASHCLLANLMLSAILINLNHPLPCNRTYLDVPGFRTWASWRSGHYSFYHTGLLPLLGTNETTSFPCWRCVKESQLK